MLQRRKPFHRIGKFPWNAAHAALKWREEHPREGWQQTTEKFCPCGRAEHKIGCQRKLRQAVEELKLEREIKAALDPLFSAKKPGRPADYPTHVLVAIIREKEGNPRVTYAELVRRYCPCRLDFPLRAAHTEECREAMRRALRRFKKRLRELGPARDYLLKLPK